MDSELIKVSVPTKKIALEISDTEKIEVVLRPFKQKYFAEAIQIINKYFDSYSSVQVNYLAKRQAILDRYPGYGEEQVRNEALADFNESFNEVMEIAKAVLNSGKEGMAEEIKTIIDFSINKATQVVSTDDGTERSPVDIELDDLTWGECLVLLANVIGLNMDFFARNSKAIDLIQVAPKNPAKPKQTPSDPAPPSGEKAGEELSAA